MHGTKLRYPILGRRRNSYGLIASDVKLVANQQGNVLFRTGGMNDSEGLALKWNEDTRLSRVAIIPFGVHPSSIATIRV